MSAQKRLIWPDVAKGISILGVVLLHIGIGVPEGESTWLYQVNTWLDPLRMPLFFVVSGYFSTKILNYTLRDVLIKRVWFFFVPYLLWVSVELWTKNLEWQWVFGNEPLSFSELGLNLLLGHNMGWFLHALIIFNLVLVAVRKLHPAVAMLISFTPVLLLPLNEHIYFIGKALMYLPLFFMGVYLRRAITVFVEAICRLNVAALSFAAMTYAVGYFSRDMWNQFTGEVALPWYLPGMDYMGREEILLLVRFVEQTFQLPMALVMAVAISYIPFISSFFAFIGRNTLPIYLGHPIALTVGYHYVQIVGKWEISMAGEGLLHNTWFWTIVCIGLSAAGGLMLWSVSKLPVVGWSVYPPSLRQLHTMVMHAPVLRQAPGRD